MRLKLDENLGHRVAELFRLAAFEVQTVAEEGIQGAEDPSLLAACWRERRCLVTLDLDFANPLAFPPGEYAGIVVIRLPAKARYQDLLSACRSLIGALDRKDVTGRLWVAQLGRIREYRGSQP